MIDLPERNRTLSSLVNIADFLTDQNGLALRGPFPPQRKGGVSEIHCERNSRGPDPLLGLYTGRVIVAVRVLVCACVWMCVRVCCAFE